MPRRLIAACGLALLLAACEPPPPGEWVEADGHRWRPVNVVGDGPGFTEISPRRSGVAFSNRLARETAMTHDHLLVGSGVAIGDFDGDGLADLYLARLEGSGALYHNTGGWRFEDVTEAAGVGAADRYSTGAVFADVDGDGDLDLFVTSLGGPDVLYRNDGDGGFTDVTTASGLASELGSTTSTFSDVDGDGDLDAYVARYKVESAADVLRPYEQSGVDLVVERDGTSEIAEEFRGHFRMEMRDGRSVAMEQADPDRLYLNRGDGTFEAVPWDSGRFLDADGEPLTRDLDDFGLAARFYDVDGDGDPDLYVCNDFDDPDQLWLNDGRGFFRAAPALALRTSSHASMAVDFADIDRDGAVDFFVADMLSSDPGRRLAQVPLHATLEKPAGRIEDRPQVGRNTLFLGRGDGTWAQIAEMAGVDGSEWTWGSLFLDVDLDGYEDLLVANGHGRDMRDGDALDRIRGLRGAISWTEAKSLYPDLPTRNRAFRNRGDRTFEDMGTSWGFGAAPDVSHGIAAGDLDGDGDLDLVVNRLNDEVLLLRNEAAAPRVSVRLVAAGRNGAGIGARVRLEGGAVPAQEREVTAGGLYLSSSEPSLTFAAGSGPMAIHVEWPSGAVSTVPVQANRTYEIREPASAVRTPSTTAESPAPGGARGDPASLFTEGMQASGAASPPFGEGTQPSGAADPLFVDVTPPGAVHHEDNFDDYGRQPLLPYRLSRTGPGLTWHDVDSDGDADLVLPSGAGGAFQLLVNDGARGFRVSAGAVTGHDQTTVLPAWGQERGTLLIGRSSYDARSPEEARGLAGVVLADARGAEAEGAASAHLSSTGALAQADVDGDGDLDLFVGGRSVPAFYPLPATSRLLLASGDGWRDAEVAAFADLGLVSGAVFTDLDDDGDPDLALAVEWGSLRVFQNDGGVFVDATEAWGLTGLTGLWRGIAAGDLDGDGRMDLVATNQGRNTRWTTSRERPLTVLHGDVDRSGTWEVGVGRAREVGGPVHPLARYEQLRPAVPGFQNRVPSFEAFGEATLTEVFGVDADRLFGAEVATFDHIVLLGRGGRFEVAPLPWQAQLAPAFGVAVGDVDGDGAEDVLLAQNFFPTDPYSPRYDAGRGLILLGDGTGGLTALSGDRSGVRVYGDQRGLAVADFDGDARLDFAVAQNGASVRVFQNRAALPGLRVRLEGQPSNPAAIGARVRLRYSAGYGPAREVRSGGGYWSADDPVQVMGKGGVPIAVEVRWPDGVTTEVPVGDGIEIVIRAQGGA